ncbi:MAG: hypothetical protein R2802_00400 [Flavobacteriaceae bacterium]
MFTEQEPKLAEEGEEFLNQLKEKEKEDANLQLKPSWKKTKTTKVK